jgi:DNA-3-methyladenine glycosylase II
MASDAKPAPEVWPEATRLLRTDPAFGPVVRAVGPVPHPPRQDPYFATLVRSIVYQQLAGKAAATIHGRVVEALGGVVTPEAVTRTPEEALRAAGLSRNKLAAIEDLAAKSLDGTVPLGELERLPDRDVIERLTVVRGVGPWTAQMFLLFRLLRPDVWPVTDLGVRAGWARVLGLEALPGPRELEPLGEPYRPWRSAVAWYCWRALELEK